MTKMVVSVISGFRRDVDEIYAFLRYYAASSDNPLPTFRNNISVPSSRVKKSVKDYYSTLRNIRENCRPRNGYFKLQNMTVT
jgi:hypothetical protein